MRLKTMILSMKVLLLGAAVTTATATATAQGTTRTTATERTVHAGEYVKTITVGTTATEITSEGQTVTAAKGAKVKVTAATPPSGKRARLVITKAASSSSGQTQSGTVTKIEVKGDGGKTTVYNGRILQMVATVDGTGDYNKTVTWYVEDLDASGEILKGSQKYATINDNGQLLGIAVGKVRVFATSNHDNSTVGTCNIEVVDLTGGGSGQQGGDNGGTSQSGTQTDPEISPSGGGGGAPNSEWQIKTSNHLTVLKVDEEITLSLLKYEQDVPATWIVKPKENSSGEATLITDNLLKGVSPGWVTVFGTLVGDESPNASIDIEIVE